MNFKKNFKRFFTMSRSAEGFTLVELIVVIAILGILVGVGIPAYGSYVEAANLGVDRNNLAIVNNCFAVACIENGVDPATGISGAQLTWDGNKVTDLTSVALNTRTVTDAADGIKTSFKANLGAGVEFKVHTSSDITFSNGKFVSSKLGAEGGAGGNGGAGNGGAVSGAYNGLANDKNFMDSVQPQINKVNDSAFAKDMTNDQLLGQITGVTDLATLALFNTDSKLGQIVFNEEDPTYRNNLATMLGMKDAAELETYLANKYGTDEAGMQAQAQFLANSLVLSAAQNATNRNVSDIKALLSTGNLGAIAGSVNAAGGMDGMTNAALLYGMYTAYNPSGAASMTSPDQLATLPDGEKEGFITYLQSLNTEGSQASKDLDGYLGALSIVNSAVTKDKNTALQAMTNGYSDPELKALLDQFMPDVVAP